MRSARTDSVVRRGIVHTADDLLQSCPAFDNADEVLALASRHGFAAMPMAMKNTHHAETNELVISRNLGWL